MRCRRVTFHLIHTHNVVTCAIIIDIIITTVIVVEIVVVIIVDMNGGNTAALEMQTVLSLLI